MNKTIVFFTLLSCVSCEDVLQDNNDTYIGKSTKCLSMTENEKISSLIEEFRLNQVSTRSEGLSSKKEFQIMNIEKRVYMSSPHDVLTRSYEYVDSIPVYYVDFKEDGQKGFSILTTDNRVSSFFCYSEYGSVSDTIFNKNLSYIISLIPNYCTSVLDSLKHESENTQNNLQTKSGRIDDIKVGDIIEGFNYGERRFVDQYKTAVLTIQTPGRISKIQNKPDILRTTWDQLFPYNANCPIPSNCSQKAPAGCVAVAVAQICSYHQKPTGYDWSGLNYSKHVPIDNPILVNEIARLMSNIGRDVQMAYECHASGSTIDKAKNVFIKYGYSCSDPLSDSRGESFNEIDMNRPVYVRGTSSDNNGHAWVMSGYKEIYTRDTLIVLKRDVSQFNTYNPEEIPDFIWNEMKLANKDNFYYYNEGRSKYPYYNLGWGGSGNGFYDITLFTYNRNMNILKIQK